jgi:hypothetical protein
MLKIETPGKKINNFLKAVELNIILLIFQMYYNKQLSAPRHSESSISIQHHRSKSSTFFPLAFTL